MRSRFSDGGWGAKTLVQSRKKQTSEVQVNPISITALHLALFRVFRNYRRYTAHAKRPHLSSIHRTTPHLDRSTAASSQPPAQLRQFSPKLHRALLPARTSLSDTIPFRGYLDAIQGEANQPLFDPRLRGKRISVYQTHKVSCHRLRNCPLGAVFP